MKTRTLKHRFANRRRFLLVWIAVAVMVAATAVTVISRQKRTESPMMKQAENKPGATGTRTYVTRRVGGQDIHIDSQNSEIKPLTPEEAQKLANGLAPLLDNSADGLTEVRHADGSFSMDLQGRFKNVAVARVNQDGVVEVSCVDNPRAAAKFFGIDRKLIENAPTARRRTTQK